MSQENNIKGSKTPGKHYLHSQRLSGLDLARFLAMAMMIQGHVIYALASPEVVNTSEYPWNIWHYLRGLTAPVFLFVSGAVHVFANKRDESGKLPRKTIFRRIRMALLLVTIGYLMMFPAQRIWDVFFVDSIQWTRFFQVNILQLFGVSLLMLLLMFIVTRSDKNLGILCLIIAIIITLINPIVHTIDWFSILPEFFASYLSQRRGSFFPIFPFTSFLFFGAAAGALLKSIKPENRTKFIIHWGLIIGVVLILISNTIEFVESGGNFLSPSITSVSLTLIRLGFVLMVISLTSFIYLLTPRLANIYSMFSKRALFIYIIHLVVLYGSAFYNGLARSAPNSLNLEQTLLAVIAVELISIASVFFYEYSIRKYPKLKKVYSGLILLYLCYLLFV